jgi:hypothetical protein
LGRKLGWILFSSPMPYPSWKKRNIVKLSHISVVMRWHTILFDITLFLQRQSSYGKCSIDKCAVMSKRNGHLVPWEVQCTMLDVLLVLVLVDFCWPCTHSGVSWNLLLLLIVASWDQTNLQNALSWHAQTAHRITSDSLDHLYL